MTKARKEITLGKGEEMIVTVGKRRYILRGVGIPEKGESIQFFSEDYTKEKGKELYAGTMRGIVQGSGFVVGYVEGIRKIHLAQPKVIIKI